MCFSAYTQVIVKAMRSGRIRAGAGGKDRQKFKQALVVLWFSTAEALWVQFTAAG